VKTEIRFLEAEPLTFEQDADVKMTPLGVEITERRGEESVRVLFPWARIERVTQTGSEIAAIYHY
jgi:hypothetical protein